MDTWTREMHKGVLLPMPSFSPDLFSLPAGGEAFHFSFLSLFRLYVRLFLNSFGIQDSVSSVITITYFPPFLLLPCIAGRPIES